MLEDFQLLIKPAGADCNMSCGYCFYRRTEALYDAPGPHRMSREVLEALVRRYLKLRLPQTVFCWQGGEPTLMGLDFFRAAAALMQQHGRAGQPVSNALQTNGLFLDEEWCDFLLRYRFLVGLSVDGPAEIHDRYRVIAGGRGSHAEVMSKLRLMQDRGVEFNILTVVSDANAGRAREIYTYFRELGVAHMQFIPCVETDPATLRPAPFSVAPAAFGDFLCGLFDAWLPEAMDGVSIRTFDGLLRRQLTGRTGLCAFETTCGQCPVIEYNGDVYPCDFFVQPEWRMGNILSMSFEKLVRRKCAREFRRAKYRLPDDCADCRWKDLCKGGCLKDRQRISGGFDAASYFCESYKRLFEHAAQPLEELGRKVRERCPEWNGAADASRMGVDRQGGPPASPKALGEKTLHEQSDPPVR